MRLLKNKHTAVFILILLVGLAVRFWALGTIPHGFSWDEAAIGYNGYAILTTRRDEWIERLPVSFKSFGDYKAPLAIYLNGFSTAVFGLTPFGVRLPFAIFGALGMLAFYGLCTELFWQHPQRRWYALCGLAFFATSPWAIHFSRIGFESGIALTLVIGALFFFFKALRTGIGWLLELSTLSFVASLYAYHSSKIAVPLIVMLLVALYWRELRKGRLSTAVWPSLFFGSLALWPLIKDAVWGHGLERANTTLLGSGLPVGELLVTVIKNGLQHLSPPFLVFGASDSLRHSDGQYGVLLPTVALLLVLGLLAGFFKRRTWPADALVSGKVYLFTLGYLAAAILPASVALEVPHPNRSLLALPAFLLVALVGLSWLVELCRARSWTHRFVGSHGEDQLPLKSLLGTLVGIQVLFFTAYLHHYFTKYSALSSGVFADGYLEAFNVAVQYEKGANGLPKADQILFTSEYGQPYIYALFARKTNPIYYQGGSLSKYIFTDTIAPSDLDRSKTLIVAGQSSHLPLNEADRLIFAADGTVKFAIYRSRNW